MAANTTTSVSRYNPPVVEMQDTITRLANATAYVIGDIISDHATVPTAAGYYTFDTKHKKGASVRFTDFTFYKSDTDTTNAAFDLLLFTTLPALANLDDGEPAKITDAEMLFCKGRIRFAAGTSWSTLILGDLQTVRAQTDVVLLSTSAIVYGVLTAAAAYTPASGEILTITAHAELR